MAIREEIEIVTGDQVYDRDQASVWLHHTIGEQKGNYDRASISGVCHARTRLLPSRESDMWHAMSKTWG